MQHEELFVEIDARAVEATVIARLIKLADTLAGEMLLGDSPVDRLMRERETATAVLQAAARMAGDLVEELDKLRDRVGAAQDGRATPSGPGMPLAA